MALATASASRIGQHEGGVVFGSIGQVSPIVICQSHGTTLVASNMGPPRTHVSRLAR